MNIPSATFYWVENKYTKKLFKNRPASLNQSHQIINNSLHIELNLADPDFANIPTELAVLVEVRIRYGEFQVNCNVFSRNMTVTRNLPDGEVYSYIRYAYMLEFKSKSSVYLINHRGFWLRDANRNLLTDSPHLEYSMNEESLHRNMMALSAIPSIAKEIIKNITNL